MSDPAPALLDPSLLRSEEAPESAAVEFLLSRIDYERTPPTGNAAGSFKLARMQALLEALGDPHRAAPCVHIAGSKGKGSTAAMLASILTRAGYRTGLFTSPHVHRFEERIQLDGRMIPPERVAEFVEQLRPVAAAMDVGPLGGPTFFELTTAMAWLYFRTVAAEIVVLEVGLGGRLDATNLCRPLATIITSISRDHTRLLGDRLEQIAREKAGIIKPGVPVITGVGEAGPLDVIRSVAAEHQAACTVLGEALRWEARPAGDSAAPLPRLRLDLQTPWREHHGLTVPLPGEHQARNAALAAAAADCLDAAGEFRIAPEAVAAGLAAVRWPLRVEVVGERPLVILDAAHNDASIAALLETLRPLRVRRRIVIFGASRDKDAPAMLRLLAGCFDEIVVTRYLGNPRAYPVEELSRLAAEAFPGPVRCSPHPQAAWELARGEAAEDDLICVTGSFFLAGEIRALFQAGTKPGTEQVLLAVRSSAESADQSP